LITDKVLRIVANEIHMIYGINRYFVVLLGVKITMLIAVPIMPNIEINASTRLFDPK
jgi:hypothetical protein